MSKHCILINGTMGVGKTTVCKELRKLLPASVFLDGDWCWYSHPFTVTEQTKQVVMENIGFMLQNFLNNQFMRLNYQTISAAAIIFGGILYVLIAIILILEKKWSAAG